ncbi:aminotransferase class III-fold pyridoxal phosphate-dependent enzyme [Polynucleobacter necessarius]|uniref:aminotransferase class III-fold pyridoxal phosphate-dependent enzyme n=1 Tax=Polynucleobacter necessarius TaxID=576610 RepID=UPI0018D55787|nr:aminotransferase class III-fold pyridoxal phosphate-dependent enzyme [Polynucleobacter necessarius]
MQSAKGAYYFDDHGRKLFDGLSGLWCSPLGHVEPRIGAAIQKQFESMDDCPAFQMASETTFSLANRIAQMAPKGLDKVFFTNSGENLKRNKVCGSYSTGGSRGIRTSEQYVRKSGAAARMMLVRQGICCCFAIRGAPKRFKRVESNW